MHASVGREVQSIRLQVPGLAGLLPAQAQESGSEDLTEFLETLLCAHQVGVEWIGAREAIGALVETDAEVIVQPASVHLSSYVTLSRPGPLGRPWRSIQPRTVSGSLSSSRAISQGE